MPTEDSERWRLLDSTAKQVAIVSLFKKLRSQSVEPILIKGWAVARTYPPGHSRNYTDIDLAVAPDDFESATAVLRDGTRYGAPFDLHAGLRQLDRTSWETLFERSRLVSLEGEGIRLLSEEDNLRVTATHWLMDGGLYKERLFDIKYLVEKRKQDFDWDISLDSSGPIRREWVLAAIAAARAELDLEPAKIPEYIINFNPPAWFFRALKKEWRRGVYTRIPLGLCVRKPKLFFRQILRRFPPNPIAAMVDTEGNLSDGSPIAFQMRSFRNKIRPFFSLLARSRRTQTK